MFKYDFIDHFDNLPPYARVIAKIKFKSLIIECSKMGNFNPIQLNKINHEKDHKMQLVNAQTNRPRLP